MKKWIPTTLIALTLLFTIACETQNTQDPDLVWSESSLGFRVSMQVDRTTLNASTGTPLNVTIVIQNKSGVKIDMETLPSFSLDNSEFVGWAPVDILQEKNLPMNGRCIISLLSGESLTKHVDITDLAWENSFSSIWPHKQFYDLIAAGTYSLKFEFNITSSNVPEQITSNVVEITVVD